MILWAQQFEILQNHNIFFTIIVTVFNSFLVFILVTVLKFFVLLVFVFCKYVYLVYLIYVLVLVIFVRQIKLNTNKNKTNLNTRNAALVTSNMFVFIFFIHFIVF